jgi:hypothetical protein
MAVAVSGQNFRREVLDADRAVLVASLGDLARNRDQLLVLESLSRSRSFMLKACVLSDGFAEDFMRKNGIGNTPAFVLYHSGEELGRLLGRASLRSLESFLAANLGFGGGRTSLGESYVFL